MTELVALFSALLKTYPALMKSLRERSSADLAQLVVQTYDELSRGKPITTPEGFLCQVKEQVPEGDWKLAVRCTRSWEPTTHSDPGLTENDELERMALGLLWMSAMITELQQRELDGSQSPALTFESLGPVQ